MSRWRTKEVEELVVVGKADLGWWWVLLAARVK